MRVHCQCGYYSNYAEKVTGVPRPRDPPFWESYMYSWAVKSGQYKRDFYIIRPNGQRLDINRNNFSRVRPTFGSWAASVIDTFEENDIYLVPVPDTEALAGAKTYRTLEMVQQAFKQTALDERALDGLRWTQRRQKAHEGGSRKRKALLGLLEAKREVKGKNVVLIDEIVTTGGNLLASQDKLVEAGATIVGAVTCGLSVYDVKEAPPFKPRSFDLTEQLKDYSAAS
jgi:hypothetical protein